LGAGGALAGTNGPYSGHHKNLKSGFEISPYNTISQHPLTSESTWSIVSGENRISYWIDPMEVL